jgi:cyclophilin family peptidyl-prolyl cis-trans isomerase
MATHKAPTAVTLVPTTEKSGFALLVERYWKLGAGVAVVVAVAVLALEYNRRSGEEEHDKSWEALRSATKDDGQFSATLSGAPGDLMSVADRTRGKHAGAWALWIAATSALEKQEYDVAIQSLERLRSEYPTHPLVANKFKVGEESEELSAVDRLSGRLTAQRDWRASHASMFANPELPADAPKVKINTDRGTILVGLYSDKAPKHVENFLKLCREGSYNGTKFHRIGQGFMVQGGDPNTIQGDPATWGLGGPGYKLDREETGLRHFKGALAAAKGNGEVQSSGSQFYITVADRHDLDKDYVVFGKVLEGQDIADTMSKDKLAPGSLDRPETPVVVQSTEVVGP